MNKYNQWKIRGKISKVPRNISVTDNKICSDFTVNHSRRRADENFPSTAIPARIIFALFIEKKNTTLSQLVDPA
jgi:hypothetical protein